VNTGHLRDSIKDNIYLFLERLNMRIVLLCVLFTCYSARALTFQVNSHEDLSDKFLGDGLCTTTDNNKCTLRAAIEEAAFTNAETLFINPKTILKITKKLVIPSNLSVVLLKYSGPAEPRGKLTILGNGHIELKTNSSFVINNHRVDIFTTDWSFSSFVVNAEANLELFECSFTGQFERGVITTSGHLVINRSIFHKLNIKGAADWSSIISQRNGNILIENSQFYNNSSNILHQGLCENDGLDTRLDIVNSHFIANSGFVLKKDCGGKDLVKIRGTFVSGNAREAQIGTISIDTHGTTVEISDSSIIGNAHIGLSLFGNNFVSISDSEIHNNVGTPSNPGVDCHLETKVILLGSNKLGNCEYIGP
jgi:hypothetical protein